MFFIVLKLARFSRLSLFFYESNQVDAPFRTTSAPPSEQAQFHYHQIAWRNQTQMQMGSSAGQQNQQQQPGPGMPQGQLPSGPGVATGPGGMPHKGPPQQAPQQAQGAQQQVNNRKTGYEGRVFVVLMWYSVFVFILDTPCCTMCTLVVHEK